MKIVLSVILGIVLAVGGFFAGVRYESAKIEYKAEEVIGKEIALLEKTKGIPSCAIAKNPPELLNLIRENGVLVIWSYDGSKDFLKRLVIDDTMISAYEELEDYCSAGKLSNG